MYNLLQAISESSVASLFVALLVVWFVAIKVASDHGKIMLWSKAVGGFAFLAYFANAYSSTNGEELFVVLLRAAVLGGIVAFSSAIAFTALALVWSHVVYPVGRFVGGIPAAFGRKARGLWWLATSGKRRKQELDERTKQAQIDDILRKQELLKRLQCEQDQERRVKARSNAELLFWQHVAEVKGRFTKKMFDDYMRKYMGDEHRAAEVEDRGSQLQTIIDHHREMVRPAEKNLTIESLVDWYVAEKERTKKLPLDEELKDEFMVELDMRFSDLKQEILSKMRP